MGDDKVSHLWFEKALGERRWKAMCLLSDLHRQAAEGHREFVVGDGDLSFIANWAADVRRTLDEIDALAAAASRPGGET